MLKTIWLYGLLRKRCGVDKFQVRADSVKEAIEALSANFYEELRPLANRPRLLCRVKDFDTERKLYDAIPDGVDDIHLYPCLSGGGGGGGFFKIILGILLIASVFVLPMVGVWGLTIAATTGSLTALGMAAIGIGAGLILGGAMQLMGLTPKADVTTAGADDSSKYLGATQNTTKIGTPIAIIMGEILQFGQLISFNVDAADVAV